MTIANVKTGGGDSAARPRRRWWRRVVWALAGALLVIAAMHQHVLISAGPHVFAAEVVPPADCILVPGARIYADGRPYPMLADRLASAHDLFVRGKAKHIVLSGRGGGGIGDDEVGAMRRWLVERGVPADALVDDALGLRTLDTMRRCRMEYGMRSAIVVTNPFHVARSVFLARSVGLDACGVEAPRQTDYSTATMLRNQGREVLARVWAWLDVFVFGAS